MCLESFLQCACVFVLGSNRVIRVFPRTCARTLRESRRRRAEESVVHYSLQRGNATESDPNRSDVRHGR